VSAHITDELALALIALPPDDPERKEAFAHAAECSACRALLRDSEQMLRLLDDECNLPAVDPAFKARVHAAVLGSSAPVRTRWQSWALVLGALLSLLMVWLDAHTGPAQAALGLRCALYELGCAVVPFALVATSMMRGALRVEPRGLALAAMAGALVGQALLLAECPAQGAVSHTLPFHFAGVLLAALLGMGAGRVMLARAH
jgi:hypothetical protein